MYLLRLHTRAAQVVMVGLTPAGGLDAKALAERDGGEDGEDDANEDENIGRGGKRMQRMEGRRL